MSKEMLGGCCVCSDESGWTENPLVYCDGQGCNVAVHQACYGIVSVPSGSWFCRKCESQERAVRVRCELCPSKDGALKRTDNNGWAHVVCALYIPEVRFGNVTTMEPIILQLIPPERFTRTCYICQEQGKGSKATTGACMQCNKLGCKQQFHVTCAQAVGLLCEEAGNFMDNVKYCGYCQHHYSKLKKGGNVKTIPPYKPIATAEHDSSPDKDSESGRPKKKSYLALKATTSAGLKAKGDEEAASVYSMDTSEDDAGGGGGGVTLKIGTTSSHPGDASKFTTSNFVETVIIPGEPLFGEKATTSPDSVKGKKRKSSGAGVKTEEVPVTSAAISTIVSSVPQAGKNPVVGALSNLKNATNTTPAKPIITQGKPSVSSAIVGPKSSNLTVYGTGTKITIAASREDVKKPKQEGPPPTSSVNSPVEKSNPDLITPANTATSALEVPSEMHPGKRSRSSSLEKGRKPKRTPNKRPTGVKEEIESPPGSPDASRGRKKPLAREEKDVKPLQNITAPHMLGNQLNPSSSMANKMHDTLNQELEAHSVFTQDTQSPLVGPPLTGKFRTTVSSDKTATLNAANSLLSLGNSTASSQHPQPLESLLERQWEQGSQFLMEQAQHFDIASLLSCLHQLKSENMKLEEHVNSLLQRRDHLLAVNARLAVPLTLSANTGATSNDSPAEAVPRPNGVTPVSSVEAHAYPAAMHNRAPPQQSPTLRGPMSQTGYSQPGRRAVPVANYQGYPQQQMSSVNSPQLGVHQQM